MYDEYSRRCFLIRSAGVAAAMVLGNPTLTACTQQDENTINKNGAGEMIAYCGLNCATCRIYLVAREKNPEKQKEMKRQIALYIKEHFDPKIRVDDITDCDGCTVKGGRLFSGCQKCDVRKCAMEKGIKNCAYCSEYACDKLNRMFASEGEEGGGKKRLDAIKAKL